MTGVSPKTIKITEVKQIKEKIRRKNLSKKSVEKIRRKNSSNQHPQQVSLKMFKSLLSLLPK